MIDALFGSKTRVKLLHLFLNNQGNSFYVREITRKIDEQINSVRRELSNMLAIGIIISDSADNKLYYQVNQRYEYYVPLRMIFNDNITNNKISKAGAENTSKDYENILRGMPGLRLAIFSGILVQDSISSVDIILVGDLSTLKIKSFIKHVENNEGRDINYSVLSYEDFYYRLSVKDKFITEILSDKHNVIIDQDNILTK